MWNKLFVPFLLVGWNLYSEQEPISASFCWLPAGHIRHYGTYSHTHLNFFSYLKLSTIHNKHSFFYMQFLSCSSSKSSPQGSGSYVYIRIKFMLFTTPSLPGFLISWYPDTSSFPGHMAYHMVKPTLSRLPLNIWIST